MKRLICRIKTISVVLVMNIVLMIFISCKSDSDILATYMQNTTKQTIIRKDFNRYLTDLNTKELKTDKQIKAALENLVTYKILSNKAGKDKLTELAEYRKVKNYIKESLAYQLYISDITKDIKKSTLPTYKIQEIMIYSPESIRSRSIPKKVAAIRKLKSTIMDVYTQLVNKTITFKDAVKKYSMMKTKQQDGILKHRTLYEYNSFHQWAIYMITTRKHNKKYVLQRDSFMYSDPQAKRIVTGKLSKGKMVIAAMKQPKNSRFARVEFDRHLYTYIKKSDLKLLDPVEEISYPIPTQTGWLIVRVVEQKTMSKDDYIAKTKQQYPKLKGKAAEKIGEIRWNELLGKYIAEEIKRKTEAEYLINIKPFDTPVRNKQVIYQVKDITITSDDLLDFIKTEEILKFKYYNRKEKIYKHKLKELLLRTVWSKKAIKNNIFDKGNNRSQLETLQMIKLAKYWMYKKWFLPITFTDQEVRNEYNAYVKKHFKGDFSKYESFAKAKQRFENILRVKKFKSIYKINKIRLLKHADFKML